MNIVEYFRKLAIEQGLETPTIRGVWPTWKNLINIKLGDNPNAQSFFELGNSLYDIFQSTNPSNENHETTLSDSQAQKAKSGVAWEFLNLWYINSCSYGSKVAAFKKKEHVPRCLIDVMAITHGNRATTSESDLKVCAFPNQNPFNNDIYDNEDILRPDGSIIIAALKRYYDEIVKQHIGSINLLNLQTKVNFNDTIQSPMLYNVVYSLGAQVTNVENHFRIGRNNSFINQLNSFNYAFSTVPTNNYETITSSKLEAVRGRTFSGGCYWSRPTEDDVARNLNEIFNANIRAGYENHDFNLTLNNSLTDEGTLPNYFGLN